ncbi:hypothetical protein E2562_038169 [Oryza meyeriana var. granulata]|uniref:Uncharacterized protein n=1 Tax=Oryza meyeriana var. granulata TaxID=110450 RepID=A0A6G1CKH0_9ORYZ|nr:hypothetical protein E2562_038169 [Oryza meyeriana var. granulata]
MDASPPPHIGLRRSFTNNRQNHRDYLTNHPRNKCLAHTIDRIDPTAAACPPQETPSLGMPAAGEDNESIAAALHVATNEERSSIAASLFCACGEENYELQFEQLHGRIRG